MPGCEGPSTRQTHFQAGQGRTLSITLRHASTQHTFSHSRSLIQSLSLSHSLTLSLILSLSFSLCHNCRCVSCVGPPGNEPIPSPPGTPASRATWGQGRLLWPSWPSSGRWRTEVRRWPAWKCVSREKGPSHPGTPIFLRALQGVFGPPGNAPGRCVATHIQAHQPSMAPSRCAL